MTLASVPRVAWAFLTLTLTATTVEALWADELELLEFGVDLQEPLDALRFRYLDGLWVGLEAPITTAAREGQESRGSH